MGRRRGGQSAQTRAVINMRKPCDTSRCPNRRHWTARLCHACQIRRNRYGTERATRIHKYQWAPLLADVQAVFAKYADHPALAEAETKMASLLVPGEERRRKLVGSGAAEFHLQVELARLRRGKVTPRVALEAVTAVWCLSYEQPSVLPGDRRLDFALSNAVLALARYRHNVEWNKGTKHVSAYRPAASCLAILGRRIMESGLAVFAMNVYEAIQEEKKIKNDHKAALFAKLHTPPLAAEHDVPLPEQNESRVHSPADRLAQYRAQHAR